MGAPGTFLTASELADFQRPGRFKVRHVAPEKGPNLALKEYCTELLRPHNPRFTARVIAVQKDDGMSWSAEHVLQAADEVRGNFACIALRGSTSRDELPELASLLGVSQLLKLAAKCRLTNRFIPLFLSRLLYLVVFASGIAAELLRIYTLPNSAWVVATAIAAGLFIKDPLSAWLSRGCIKTSKATFIGNMKACDVSAQPWNRLIHLAAKALQSHPFPRFVVIDNFDALDDLTRTVILRYFDQLRDEPIGREVWCIFEATTGTTFSAHASLGTDRSMTFARVDRARQLVLSSDEKSELIDMLGLAEDQARFTAVKSVCRLSCLAAKDRTKAFAEYLRSTTAKPADVADFVGLIGMAALDGRREFRRQWLMSLLSRKDGLTAKVLVSILPETKPNKKDLIGLMDTLARRELSTLVEVPDDGNTITIEPEAAHALTASATELGLDKLVLCHIFWAITTYHDLQGLAAKCAVRSWNLRPLVAHLGSIPSKDITAQEPELIAEILDALRFATEKALQTCLFAEIPALMRKVAELLEYELLADQQERRLDRALKNAWRAFALLGDDKILSTIERLNEQLHPVGTATTVPQPTAVSALQGLFLASLPESAEAIWLRDKVLIAQRDASQTSSVQLYCLARASWLAMTFLPICDEVTGTQLFNCIDAADLLLDDLTASSIMLMDKAEAPSLTDAIGLGMLLWSQAIRCHRERTLTGAPSKRLEEVLSGVRMHPVLAPVQVRMMLALADKTISLAARLQPEDFANLEDFPLTAISYDLATTALHAALMVSHPFLSEDLDPQDNSLVAALLTLLKKVRETFGDRATRHPEPATWQELLDELGSLATISRVAWRRMNLAYLEEFSLVRRLQFESAVSPVTVSNVRDHRAQMSGFAALDDRSFLGLLENAALAVALFDVRELAAGYFGAMAEFGQDAKFGTDLSFDLSYMVVRLCHSSLSPDRLQRHLRRLLEPDENGEVAFFAVLRRLPETEIPSVMVFLRYACGDSDASGLLMAFAAYRDRLASPEMRDEVAAYLDSLEVQQKIESGKSADVDVDDLLSRWSGWTRTRFYPGVLASLLYSHRGSDLLKDAGLACLGQRGSPLLDSWSAWANLALALCEVLKTNDPRLPLAFQYLQGGVERWSSALPARRNIRAYEALQKHDPDQRAEYRDKIMQWNMVKIQRDYEQIVPALIAQNRFFLLFQEFCSTATIWKLPISAPPDFVWEHVADQEGVAELQRWKNAHGDRAPVAIGDQFMAPVDVQFLKLGITAFSRLTDGHELSGLRAAFDREAKRAMPKLLNTILNLPELPASIRRLMAHYSSHVLEARAASVAEHA